MLQAMSENSEPSVIGALPHSRPHRRSDKRAARPTGSEPTEAAAAEDGAPADGHESSPCAANLFGIAVQAAAELAEIGLTAGTRALRIAISRLPRP